MQVTMDPAVDKHHLRKHFTQPPADAPRVRPGSTTATANATAAATPLRCEARIEHVPRQDRSRRPHRGEHIILGATIRDTPGAPTSGGGARPTRCPPAARAGGGTAAAAPSPQPPPPTK